MNASLTSLVNPVWANEEHTLIDCIITTSQFGDEQLPFTADKNDVEQHGREMFSALVSGNYGPIAEYVKPANVKATLPSGVIPGVIL